MDCSIEELISREVPQAKKLALRFYQERTHVGIDCDDYIGAAFLALCDAAQRFDPSKGMSFRSYSFMRIRGCLYDLIRKDGVVNRSHLQNQKRAAAARAAQSATDCALLTQARICMRQTAALEHLGIALYRTGESTEYTYLFDQDPEEQLLASDLRSYMLSLVEQLPDRERDILLRRYFADETFEEMSCIFDGVSKSWLSRIHSRALNRLRTLLLEDLQRTGEGVEWYEA